jgi:AP-1 complex subunit mu
MPENSSIVWKIKQFGGGKEFLMRAELGLPSVRGDDDKGGGMMGGFGGSMGGVQGGKSKRPIQVKFEIPYFTTSGIQVRYLKIIEPKVCTQSFDSRYNSILHDPCSLSHGRQWLQPCFG